MNTCLKISSLAILALASAHAPALVYNLSGHLLGANEVPPRTTPAEGWITGTYNDVTNQIDIIVNASGFIGTITAGHIHRAPAGTNGPIQFHLMNMGSSSVWSSDDTFTYSDTQETDLLAGNHYVNLHTTTFAGGEVRAQITATPVPEPATLAVLGLGALALRRKRARA